MTAPRQILSGATYLVTRRCAQRQFLLRPSETTNAIVAYVLAAVAARYGILVHACCVLSDHLHLVITDPRGEVPRFAQKFFGLVARALNAHLGRRESFWKGPGSYSLVRLESPEDALEKCAYTLANPVAAGLVEQGEEWPGLWSGIAGIGAGPRLVERPLVFFKQRGPMPAMASLEFVPPPGTGSAEEFRARLAARVAELEREAGDLRKEKGRRVLGAEEVLRQKTTQHARSHERLFAMNPRIAAREALQRARALLRLKAFVGAHREARRRFLAGDREVLFPPGTYLMRVVLQVRCAAAA